MNCIIPGKRPGVLDDWRQPFPGFFLYYPSRRQQPAALSTLISSGQWAYLGLLNTRTGQSMALAENERDVFLGADDTLRVYVQGYRAACLDDFFGKLFGQTSYAAGLTFLEQCGPTNNDDLGGALLEMETPLPGDYTVAAVDGLGASHFTVDLTVASAP